MATEPFVSIVVPTTGTVGYLHGMVKSVARLDYPRDRFELILLGDAETPLLQRARELAQEGGIALQVILDPVAAGEKRNRGVAAAQGEFIAFTDDDTILRKDWLRAAVRHLARNPDYAGVGGPNFTHIPINAPKCPFHHFQQDGHMAMHNPKGRVNYEPNSWGDDGGPRENPEIGFKSYTEEVSGTKQRVRSETFADHYSQARQFYISQTEIEQQHIAAAYTFELSKCQEERIRLRMLSHLMNVHDDLAKQVAEGLGVTEMPEPATPAREPITDLPPSDALSILKNPPNTFAGRKLGLFLTEGADASIVEALEKTFADEGAMVAIVTPHIQGVTLSDGSTRAADEKIDGGPSVVFDAVALVFGDEKADKIAKNKPSQDFVSDAFAHNKFIAWTKAADPLLKAAGVEKDEGTVEVSAENADDFLQSCRKLRFWQREEKLNWE